MKTLVCAVLGLSVLSSSLSAADITGQIISTIQRVDGAPFHYFISGQTERIECKYNVTNTTNTAREIKVEHKWKATVNGQWQDYQTITDTLTVPANTTLSGYWSISEVVCPIAYAPLQVRVTIRDPNLDVANSGDQFFWEGRDAAYGILYSAVQKVNGTAGYVYGPTDTISVSYTHEWGNIGQDDPFTFEVRFEVLDDAGEIVDSSTSAGSQLWPCEWEEVFHMKSFTVPANPSATYTIKAHMIARWSGRTLGSVSKVFLVLE